MQAVAVKRESDVKDRSTIITVAHNYDSNATRNSHCRICRGASPFHRAGCKESPELRSEIQTVIYRR